MLINAFGWRHAYFVLSAIIGVAVLIVNIFLRDRPEDMGLLPDGEEKVQTTEVEMQNI